MNPLIDQIKEKMPKLQQARENLKSYFIGIDKMIDKIFDSLEIWYYLPELLERPIIINLWGMTGVGKTDLVRRLAKELELEEHYLEIQLNASEQYYNNSIQDMIKYSGIVSTRPGIILLDEIQRFRTKDENGHLIAKSQYDDVWMLLSDGKFSDAIREKENLMYLLLDYKMEDEGENKPEPVKTKKHKNDEVKESKKKLSVYEAKFLKLKLETTAPIEEIMCWSNHQKIEAIKKKISEISVSGSMKTYNQALIFICGNIDDAFTMSGNVSEVNVDADILHEYTSKVDILRIKEALTKQFKPEQIARFGNNHIIYPSLSKNSFKELIARKLSNVQKRILDRFQIKINFAPNVDEAIYRNGVYPTQGVRPLFSTINNMVENQLPYFIFQALLQNEKEFTLDIDSIKNTIFSTIAEIRYEKKIDLQLDDLKSKMTDDDLALISVHETGHAVVYALLHKIAPAQIVGNALGAFSYGFVIPHSNTFGSKNLLLNEIMVSFGGLVAEEIIFGEGARSSGSEADISSATCGAGRYVRFLNMDGRCGKILPESNDSAAVYLTDIDETNPLIEQILKEQKAKTKDLLQANRGLFKKVLEKVLQMKRLLPEEFVEIAREFIPDIQNMPNHYRLVEKYASMTNDFLKE